MTLLSSFIRRTLAVTAAAACTAMLATSLPALAQGPAQTSWWSARHGTLLVDGDKVPMVSTVGVRREGDTFCGVFVFSVFDENAWVLRGTDDDGHLVVTSQHLVRGPVAALSVDDRLYQDIHGQRPLEYGPTEYFVTPTSLVQRMGSLHQGGDYEVYPTSKASGAALQAELERHCAQPLVAGR